MSSGENPRVLSPLPQVPEGQEEPTEAGNPQELPQNTLFSLKNDRNILNEIVEYEPLPFNCATITCVFAFFILYIIIVGACGMVLSANYKESFDKGELAFNEACSNLSLWTGVCNDLKDGKECDLVHKSNPHIKCFNIDQILQTSWSNWSKCEGNFKYQIRLIDKDFSILKVLPSQIGELYRRNECSSNDLSTTPHP